MRADIRELGGHSQLYIYYHDDHQNQILTRSRRSGSRQMITVPFNRTRTRTTNKNNNYCYVAVGIGLSFRYRKRCPRYSRCCCSASSSSSPSVNIDNNTPLEQKQEEENRGGVEYSSLKMLEWDKLCDSVSSFAATPFGRQAIQAQLWSLNRGYEESLKLQEETNAAVQMHNHGSCRLDFSPVDLLLVNSAIQHGRRGLPLYANEAAAVATMLEFADLLQVNLKAAIKENPDSYNRFMPLSQAIMELIINRPLVKSIRQVIDDDGSVKDSASSALKRSRNQVRMLETRLHQLMGSLIRNTMKDSFLEVSIVNGRWCIQLATDQAMSLKGLLLSSDSGTGSTVEPLSAVPLNDELQQARESVKKAEADVLLTLTKKMQKDLDDIQKVSDNIIQLDVINARATFGLSIGGVCPNLFPPEVRGRSSVPEACLSEKNNAKESDTIKREWILYMPKAYHPLLLQQYRNNLPKEIRRKQQGDNGLSKGEKGADIQSSDMQVSALQDGLPVPVDIFIGQKTRVLVITGPNTGGKTICLKTVGLAAMMAKSGLHVLSSESVQIPWFDFIFADIGDEQSLSRSLSTFSGHLKQISDIQSQSTSQSLVLLDEVGAGTNPLEGAALGMSLLESFADGGASLTIATTHHGELKSLKYSNNAFENACTEFDEVNLKPTYKILWGVPGRSNAINISEKLGLRSTVVKNARKLYGAASAEINEVILDMEIFKQEFQELLHEAEHHLMVSRNLHERLLLARRKIMEHGADLQYRKLQEISKAAAVSRFALQQRLREIRAYSAQSSQTSKTTMQKSLTSDSQSITVSNYGDTVSSYNRDIATRSSSVVKIEKLPSAVSGSKLPEIGDIVHVSSLGRKATVIRVDASKEEILVQAGNIKLKLKSTDIET